MFFVCREKAVARRLCDCEQAKGKRLRANRFRNAPPSPSRVRRSDKARCNPRRTSKHGPNMSPRHGEHIFASRKIFDQNSPPRPTLHSDSISQSPKKEPPDSRITSRALSPPDLQSGRVCLHRSLKASRAGSRSKLFVHDFN